MNSWKDFNDAKTQTLHKEDATVSTQEIKSLLTDRLREALHYLLLAGVIRHGKFVVGAEHMLLACAQFCNAHFRLK